MKPLVSFVVTAATCLVTLYVHSVWSVLSTQSIYSSSTQSHHIVEISVPAAPTTTTTSLSSVDNDTMYASALATLRCLTTPNCFPSSQCRIGVPKKIQRNKHWEEHSLCTDELLAKNDCLVYSFGIHESYEWEEKVAKLLHCEVHAFDPTMNYTTHIAPGVTFHKLGLQAEGTDMSTTHASEYDAIDPNLLLPLGQIMEKLGHVGRKLDVLAMDCEGCEWGVLEQLACSGESTFVDQLFVEFHFQKAIGLANQDDVLRAARGIQCLWHHRWHVVAIENSGSWVKNWEYTPGIGQVIHDEGFLLYLTLQRFPTDQFTPSDRLEQLANAERILSDTVEDFVEHYGTEDQTAWPESAKDVVRQRRNDSDTFRSMRNQIKHASSVSQFDNYSHVEEEMSTVR